jgi:thioredoxin 1
MNHEYAQREPERSEINALPGSTVIEFGVPWCEYCRAAQPLLEAAFKGREAIRHIKVEDGKGRSLGRSFAVRLWPTLIFLRDGNETARLVRPASAAIIADALEKMAASKKR